MSAKPAMSWADRVKAPPSAQRPSAPASASANPTLNPSAPAAPPLAADAKSQAMSSTRSTSSASSTGQNTADSVTTDQTRPGTGSDDNPSTATTSSIADSDTVDAGAKQPEQEAAAAPQAAPAPQPAPAPAVNVWAVRKERMAQQQAAATSQTSGPPAPQDAPATRASSEDASSLSDSTPKPEAAPRGRASPKHDSSRPAPQHARDTSKPGGAIAVGVSATSVPATAASQQAATPPDASHWPAPEKEAPVAQPKKSRASSEEREAKGTEPAKDQKKKAKWIPIQADITLKPSPTASPRRNQTASTDRKRDMSTDSRAGSRPRQPTAGVASNGTAPATFARADLTKSRDVSSGSSQVSSDDRPRANGHDMYAAARLSPEFHYPSSKPLTPEPLSSQASSSYHPSTRSSPRGLESLPSFDAPGERYDDQGYRSQQRNGDAGRAGRGRGRYEQPAGRFPSNRGGYAGARGGGRAYDSGRPRSPNPNGAPSPTFASTASMQGYPSQPMYGSPDFPQGAFQPYPYMPAMLPYGYPAMPPPGQPFAPADPGAFVHQRPMPRNSHLLYDPPMDETSFWVLGQIEYYLSEDNLAKDTFLRGNMDAEGWVATSMLASFNRVKALSQDADLIARALYRSTELEVVGDHVRRRGDWFRWVLPTAKPSAVKPTVANGVGVPQFGSPNGAAPLDEVQIDAIPVWQGMSPHAQPTMLFGDGAPPRHSKQRSPPSKPAAAVASHASPQQAPAEEAVLR